MRTFFVGDVHGCAEALHALTSLARADRVILLGDLFTKGPDPLGVWRWVEAHGPECVLGNHDAKMLRVWDDPAPGRAQQVCSALPAAARDWLAALPLALEGEGWLAIHAGVHPEQGLAGTGAPECFLMRRWPNDNDLGHPFWWELYQGPTRVIYGHDAMRGLQLREHSLGLDTGCCYGNALTGFCLETGEILQVSPDGTRIDPPRPFWMDYPPSGISAG